MQPLEQKLKEYEVDILGARKWLAVVINVETDEPENGLTANQTAVPASGTKLSLHQEKELIPISVRQLFEDNLKEYYRFTTFNTTAGIAIIMAVDDNNTQTKLIDLLGDICKETKRILEVTVTIGIGHSCSELEQIGKSYQTAVDALGYKAIVGTGKPIYINDVEPVSRGKLWLEPKDEAELIAAIKFGPREHIEAVIQTLMARMEDVKVHMRQYQIYMMSIINCMIRLMQQYDLNLGQMFDTEDNYMDLIAGMQRREDFAGWLTRVACRMNETMNQERDNTMKKVILEAKQYIQDHYQDPDLSVEMMCRQLHMSPAYFSTLFKKETGQTYIAYLTEVRLDQAVELLNTTEDKTYVIAQKVGYQEQNYFSYVFKKRFGVSPTKYRSTSRG